MGSALGFVFGKDTWNVTLDWMLDPLAQIWLNSLTHPTGEDKAAQFKNRVKPIILYNLKTLLFNIANILLVVATVFGVFFNPAAALVYGALGLGARYIAQQDLESLGETPLEKSETQEKSSNWTPYKVVLSSNVDPSFKVVLWRNLLPISL